VLLLLLLLLRGLPVRARALCWRCVVRGVCVCGCVCQCCVIFFVVVVGGVVVVVLVVWFSCVCALRWGLWCMVREWCGVFLCVCVCGVSFVARVSHDWFCVCGVSRCACVTCVFVSARAPVHCVLCAGWFVLFLLLVLCGLPVCVCACCGGVVRCVCVCPVLRDLCCCWCCCCCLCAVCVFVYVCCVGVCGVWCVSRLVWASAVFSLFRACQMCACMCMCAWVGA